jgi:hypothetical protein
VYYELWPSDWLTTAGKPIYSLAKSDIKSKQSQSEGNFVDPRNNFRQSFKSHPFFLDYRQLVLPKITKTQMYQWSPPLQ